jgi:epidermal growth factor receptor substrate 15
MDLLGLGVAELPAESLQPSKPTVNLHDWDAIFTGLDEPVPAGTSTGNTTESTKPLGNGTASSPAPSRPEIGKALTDVDEDDDPILKTLIGMGYPRTEALAALERYHYNLERVSLRIRTLV